MKDDAKMTEAMMDEAAADAMGSHSAAESTAYEGTLATASAEEKRFDLEMRETVARMAGTAPFMKPSGDLRGRVLQATAPATFKMEDYVKANRETNRFYKWGFYAAMAFLAAGAWYNVSLRNNMTALQGQAKGLASMVQNQDAAINNMVGPKTQQIAMQLPGGRTAGKAYANNDNKTAVVVLPEGMIPQGLAPQMSIGGKTYETIFVTVPHSAFPDVTQKDIAATSLALEKLQVDPHATPTYTATMGH